MAEIHFELSVAVLMCEITHRGRYLPGKEPLLVLEVIDYTNYAANWIGFENQTKGLINQTGKAVGVQPVPGDSVRTQSSKGPDCCFSP